MEKNNSNGFESLGFIDDDTAIVITPTNYKAKLDEYISSAGNPRNDKWRKIASRGRDYVLRNYSNDKQVDKLVDIIYKIA